MLVLLIGLIFIYHTGRLIYDIEGLDPSPVFDFLYRAGLPCGVVWWLRAEVKHSTAKSLYCQGMLANAWVILVPYHLVKTRRKASIIPILALFGSLILSQIFGFVIAGIVGVE